MTVGRVRIVVRFFIRLPAHSSAPADRMRRSSSLVSVRPTGSRLAVTRFGCSHSYSTNGHLHRFHGKRSGRRTLCVGGFLRVRLRFAIYIFLRWFKGLDRRGFVGLPIILAVIIAPAECGKNGGTDIATQFVMGHKYSSEYP